MQTAKKEFRARTRDGAIRTREINARVRTGAGIPGEGG